MARTKTAIDENETIENINVQVGYEISTIFDPYQVVHPLRYSNCRLVSLRDRQLEHHLIESSESHRLNNVR